MDSYTRRGLLKLSSLGLVSLASAAGADAKGAQDDGPSDHGASDDIQVRVTAGTRRLAAAPSLSWHRETGSRADCIAVQSDTTYQNVLGFGAAFTDAACYLFHQLSPDPRNELFRDLFHPSKIGLNVCRLCIGASDY